MAGLISFLVGASIRQSLGGSFRNTGPGECFLIGIDGICSEVSLWLSVVLPICAVTGAVAMPVSGEPWPGVGFLLAFALCFVVVKRQGQHRKAGDSS